MSSPRKTLKTYSKSKQDSEMGLITFFESVLSCFRGSTLWVGVKCEVRNDVIHKKLCEGRFGWTNVLGKLAGESF